MKNNINIFHLIPFVLILTMISVVFSGCNSTPKSQAENQVITIKRGNLNTEITGAGNLALSQTSDLAFEMAGYVQEVSVSEGASVTKGQELAKLDTSEWNKQVSTLNKALITAQRNLTAKQRALTTAQHQISAKELAVSQAQLDLQTAEYNLNQISDVKTAQDAVDRAQRNLNQAETDLQIARLQGKDTSEYFQEVSVLSDRLDLANQKLQNVLNLKDVSITTTVTMQISQATIKVEQSKNSLVNAQTAVADAETAVNDAKLDVADAEQAVKDAQNDLDEAINLSPIVTAPFDGFITKVNVAGGDEVQKGTIAMQIADPTKFKADIVVGENDIIKITEGSKATVQVDAIQGISLPAAVQHISPTATIQQGVVSYNVTVEVQPLQTMRPSISITQPSPSNPDNSSVMPRSQRQGFQPRTNQTPQSQTISPNTQQPASQISEIKAGMSVTVSIVIAENNNVLLVPNQAIIYMGGISQVQVLKDGETKTVTIKTGVNNWLYTVVTEGLTEGDQVVIPVTTGVSTTTQNPTQQRQQQITIPGTGGGITGGGGRRTN
jgi:HlyD family secretion protein